jgi:peroxiredoxin
VTIKVGQSAPEFTLRDTSGISRNPLRVSGADRGPVLLVFFKDDCPTCRYALPFLGKIHSALKEGGVRLFGVSQDDRERSLAFAKATGVEFPVLLDDSDYAVSKQYGLVSVPTFIMVDESGTVSNVTAGFSRVEMERVASELAAGIQASVPAFRSEEESILDVKPG